MTPEESIPRTGGPVHLTVDGGDAVLLRRLRTGSGRGRVHSVFTRVVNVVTPQDTLIALAARDAGHAPRTLTTDVADWSGWGIEEGQPVTFTPGVLTLEVPYGPLRLTLKGARAWHPELPSLAQLDRDELAAAATHLAQLNQEHGPLGGMLGPTSDAGPMDLAITRALAEGRTRLIAAVRDRDPDATRAAILALLGLGPGLTPAGDDFLTGVALLAALPGSAQAAFVPVLEEVLAAHPGRTTDVSLATLREAADGRARDELLDVLRLVADRAQPQQLAAPVRKVLAIGHTSGSDTLSGLIAGLHLEEELRGSL
ncbi:DUF2877 domain-containing protein [Streptomyces sp. N35]|uniref:DUF2877 domain-containing protein n=1 Tax=Streptomyces sp. N35 TaxID=2795730 RepID=UPI0018F28A1C|nr:DUF2877 domain-containing protein [Streptomyces sp. N35]